MKKINFMATSVSILALAAMATPSYAQDAETEPTEEAAEEESDGGFGGITVTANKREQNLQDVGISVSAFSGDQLSQLGIDEATEITQQIPNLQLNAWSPNLTIFNLRGVSQNNFTDNLEAPVAVYVDNAYIGSINGISGQLFDTKRVEVLRGPQGTLFGRNATGGLVHYISNSADSNEFNGYLQAGYGNFDSINVEGAVGGAIAEGVRFRAAGRFARRDGYVQSVDAIPGGNVGAGLPAPSGQDLGGEDGWGGRLNLQFDLGPDAVLNLWAKRAEDNDVDTGGYVFNNCNVNPGNGFCSVNAAGVGDGNEGVTNGITGEAASPFDNFGETAGSLNRVLSSYQADLTWDLGGVEFTSITNILDIDKQYFEDGDALPVLVLNFGTNVDYSQFSQEIRFAGESDAFKWQVGGYYLDIEIDGNSTTIGAPVLGAAGAINGPSAGDRANTSVFQQYVIDSKNWSIFGQFDYALSDTLNLTVGGRYSDDDKNIDYVSTLIDAGFADVILGTDEIFAAQAPGANEISFNDFAARVALEYSPNSDTLLFASLNRGIKGGNWTLAADVSADNFQHDGEILTSIEGGFKLGLANGALKLNGTAFHYIYDDYQAFALTGGTPQVTNSDAQTTGVELEAFYSPSRSFDMILGATWQTSNVESVNGPGTQIAPEFFPGAADDENCTNNGDGSFTCLFAPQINDVELPNAPSFSANYLLRYNTDLAGGNVAFQFDGAWYDTQFLEVTNGPAAVQNAYNVSNVSITWSDLDEKISLSGWVKNVFDQEYQLYALNLGVLGTTSFFAPPITYGGTLRFSF